ncbi:molecular chaperone DnaJ, partial [Patescibacteria group bacterium]|nr:molecular chaperone DnaJ [Patescibacteria group bacterium]
FDNFILSVNIRPHNIFERDGADIYIKITIPYSLATLGGQIDVPTVSGEVKIKLKKGTQSGTMIRLRGKGAPRLHNRGFGDEYVRLQVVVPNKLNREQKQIVEEMKREGL